MVVEDELLVDPADIVFMRAAELAYEAGQENKEHSCRAQLEVLVNCRGLKGTLGFKQPALDYQQGWWAGVVNRGVDEWLLMLAADGKLYSGKLDSVQPGGDHGPLLCEPIELDHQRIRSFGTANILYVLECFAAEAGLQ
jgi:hypothetical protein